MFSCYVWMFLHIFNRKHIAGTCIPSPAIVFQFHKVCNMYFFSSTCVCDPVPPEPPEAAASWSLSEQQLVSSLMLFCQKCFGCWCLSNLSLQKFHLQDKRPNTTCCLAQRLENVANSSWLLSLAHSSSCLYLFYFILKHNHQDKVCHFLWLLFVKAQQITSV